MIGRQYSNDSLEFDAAMQRYLADFNLNLEEDVLDEFFEEDMYRKGRY